MKFIESYLTPIIVTLAVVVVGAQFLLQKQPQYMMVKPDNDIQEFFFSIGKEQNNFTTFDLTQKIEQSDKLSFAQKQTARGLLANDTLPTEVQNKKNKKTIDDYIKDGIEAICNANSWKTILQLGLLGFFGLIGTTTTDF